MFTAKDGTGWTSKYSGDLILMVPHIHDGNTKQEFVPERREECARVW